MMRFNIYWILAIIAIVSVVSFLAGLTYSNNPIDSNPSQTTTTTTTTLSTQTATVTNTATSTSGVVTNTETSAPNLVNPNLPSGVTESYTASTLGCPPIPTLCNSNSCYASWSYQGRDYVGATATNQTYIRGTTLYTSNCVLHSSN